MMEVWSGGCCGGDSVGEAPPLCLKEQQGEGVMQHESTSDIGQGRSRGDDAKSASTSDGDASDCVDAGDCLANDCTRAWKRGVAEKKEEKDGEREQEEVVGEDTREPSTLCSSGSSLLEGKVDTMQQREVSGDGASTTRDEEDDDSSEVSSSTGDVVQQQQQNGSPSTPPPFVNLALKQWSIYLGNMLLNYIQKECKNNNNGNSCSAQQQQQQHEQDESAVQQQQQQSAELSNGDSRSNTGVMPPPPASTPPIQAGPPQWDFAQQQHQQQQQPVVGQQQGQSSSSFFSRDDSGDSTTVTSTRFCPCCHYHTHMAQQQQQQQQGGNMTQQQMQPSIPHLMMQQQQQQQQQEHLQQIPVQNPAPPPTFHQGYYNYAAAANFSSYFAAQNAAAVQRRVAAAAAAAAASGRFNNGCVQGKDPSVEFTQDIVEESEDERCFDEMMSGDSVPPIELPPCEIGRLEEISELVSSCLPSPVRREKLAVAIENDGYIKKLLSVFKMCEDLESSENLHHLYEIFKNVFLLNKNALFEIMFAEDVIFDVVGCLEHDPASPTGRKRHREYLASVANFHEVIKIDNPELLSKIHQTYRVQYIQDVVLPTPSVFEENMLSTLSSFIFFNKVEIVSLIQEDEKFLTQLFAQLTDEGTDDATREQSVRFLKEFCTFSQTLQPQSRESFFKTLNNLGVLHALEITLASDDRDTKSASIEILNFIVEFSPSMIREYMLQQLSNTEDDSLLMNVIIEQMIADSDPEMGGAVQLMGIIRILLDPENMLASVNKSEKTDFLNYFYKHCMHVFIAPLIANTPVNNSSSDGGASADGSGGPREPLAAMDSSKVQLLSLILELLSFCVEHHTYHIKNYILHKDLLRRILVLMRSRHTFLVLCALRFMRKIVALKDEFYNRYIIKGNLFAPVIDAFVSNDGRYNLLDSAILEMFEFIKMEDVKSLCSHVVENFGQQLDKITYVQTFKALKLRYDQHQDRLKERGGGGGGGGAAGQQQAQLEGVNSILRPGRFRRDPREMDEDEEMWFNDDDYEAAGVDAGNGDKVNGAGDEAASSSDGAQGGGGAMGMGATAATLSSQQMSTQQQSSPTSNGLVAAAAAAVAAAAASSAADDNDDDQDKSPVAAARRGGLSDEVSDEMMGDDEDEEDDGRPRSAGSVGSSGSSGGGDQSAKKSLVDYDGDSDDDEEEAEEDNADEGEAAPSAVSSTSAAPTTSAEGSADSETVSSSTSSSSVENKLEGDDHVEKEEEPATKGVEEGAAVAAASESDKVPEVSKEESAAADAAASTEEGGSKEEEEVQNEGGERREEEEAEDAPAAKRPRTE